MLFIVDIHPLASALKLPTMTLYAISHISDIFYIFNLFWGLALFSYQYSHLQHQLWLYLCSSIIL